MNDEDACVGGPGVIGELVRRICEMDTQERLLFVCEGQTEAAFVRGCLAPRAGGGVAWTVALAGGGSAGVAVARAARLVAEAGERGEGFVEGGRFVLVDADRGALAPGARRRARSFGLTVLPSRPCFEAEALRWLGLDAPGASAAAKAFFERRVLGRVEKVSPAAWARALGRCR
jgi:hypothetical protein